MTSTTQSQPFSLWKTALATACMAVAAHSAQAQETKIVLGMSGWTGFAPLTLADKAGIFKKNGLNVELKMIPQKDRHLALASGAIQCAATTIETHVAWNTNGVPIVQIFQMDKSYGADGIAVRDNIKSFADLKGKTVAVTRGAMEDQELAKVAPAGVDVKRFEDHAASISAFVSGQTQAIATSASTAGTIMVKNPNLQTEFKLLLKDSPNFIGVAKGEDKLRTRVNEIIAEAKKAGDLDKLSNKWLGRPAGDLPQ